VARGTAKIFGEILRGLAKNQIAAKMMLLAAGPTPGNPVAAAVGPHVIIVPTAPSSGSSAAASSHGCVLPVLAPFDSVPFACLGAL
jgi:hypothetical protein